MLKLSKLPESLTQTLAIEINEVEFIFYSRDHPTTIKKRFLSVFIVMLISPAFIYLFTSNEILANGSIWTVMGFRYEGLWMALFTPLILTAILFLGPLMTQALNGVWDIYAGSLYKLRLLYI